MASVAEVKIAGLEELLQGLKLEEYAEKAAAWCKEAGVDSVAELGTRWSEISKRFVGRTDNAIKNRYNSEVRKRERSEQRAVREAALACGDGPIHS